MREQSKTNKLNETYKPITYNPIILSSKRKSYKSYKEFIGIGIGKSNRLNRVNCIADKLVSIYGAPGSRMFFYKCAWNLSEDVIWSAVEESQKKNVKNPLALFVFICNRELHK